MTEQPPPPPAEEVSAQLRLAGQIHRLSVVLARPFQQEFAATHGVSLAEWRVLVQVVRHPGIAATQVAAATGLTAMNVSRAVHALRRQNLLTARTDPDDSRRNLLQATDAGAHLYHQLAPHAVRDIGEIMAVLSPTELRTFDSLLARLNQRTDEVLAQRRGPSEPPRP